MKSPALIFITILLPLAVHASSGDPSDGQVLEYGTRKPLAGAIVVALWKGAYHTPWQSSTVCAHVETATTDQTGRFHIKGWREPTRAFNFTTGGTGELRSYKVGYEEYMGFANNDVKSQDFKRNVRFMEPFKGTREERFKYLQRLSSGTSCSSPGNNDKTQLPFVKALYEEATTIAQTKEEHRILDDFLYAVEEAEFGYEVAEKRQIERARALKRDAAKLHFAPLWSNHQSDALNVRYRGQIRISPSASLPLNLREQ